MGTKTQHTFKVPESVAPTKEFITQPYIKEESQFITILTMDGDLGKRYSLDGDRIEKITLKNSGVGWGQTVRVENVTTLKHYLETVGKETNQAIVLGYVKGTTPKEGEAHGDTYRILTNKLLMELTGDTQKRSKVWTNKEGLNVVARTAKMFERSTWICFDLDTNKHTPPELINRLSDEGYHQCLVDLIPQLAGVEYLAVPSTSAKVLLDGKPIAAANHHIYVQSAIPSDQKRFAMATLLHAQQTVYGYTIPAINAQTKELEPHRRGTIASIIDVSVFSRARIMFEGCPSIDNGKTVPPRLSVRLPTIEVHTSPTHPKTTINTTAYLDPDFDTQTTNGFEFIRGSQGFNTYNYTDLTPTITIEYRDDETSETGYMTMQEFVDSNHTRLRCQNPFKPTSKSWSAFLTKANQHDQPITPRLVSNEYGIYVFNLKYLLEDAPQDQAPTPQDPNQTTLFQPSPTAPPPLATQTATKPTAPPPSPTLPQLSLQMSPRERVINEAKCLRTYQGGTHPMPEGLTDPLMAKYFIDRYVGGRDLVCVPISASRNATYEWSGSHYERVNKTIIRRLITESAIQGDVNSFPSSKLSSVMKFLEYSERSLDEIPILPARYTPFANGLFDFHTGKLIPHDPSFFYSEVIDVDYDPNAINDELMPLLESTSNGEEGWIARVLDVLSYLLVGGDNISHKVFWFDGLPRSGKSILVKTLNKIKINTKAIDIVSKTTGLLNSKVLLNCVGKDLLYDDDTQTPVYADREQVLGLIKKMSSGASVDLPQLFTSELLSTSFCIKMVFICNGIPQLHDHSGALADRSEVVTFDKQFVGKNADMGLEKRLSTSTNLAGFFNVLWENYLDLLQRSGYASLQEYIDNPSKPLALTTTLRSQEVHRDAQIENEPMGMFVDECVVKNWAVTGTNASVTNKQVVSAIRDWLVTNKGSKYLEGKSDLALTRMLRPTLVKLGVVPWRTSSERGYYMSLKKPPIDWGTSA